MATHNARNPETWGWDDPPPGTTSAVPVLGPLASLHQATVVLTHTQFLALTTTPQTLIAAPGVNRLIVLKEATLVARFSAAYTGDATNNLLAIRHAGDGFLITSVFNATDYVKFHDLVGQSGDRVTQLFLPSAGYSTGWTEAFAYDVGRLLTTRVNKAVVIDMQATLGGGHAANTLMITALYSVLDLTTGVWM